jgi:predicted TIM-barrel fold metal-dependent hydrolase
MANLRDKLLEEMRALRTIDCHSHTNLEREYYAVDRNLFSMRSYFNREIMAEIGAPGQEYEDIYGHCDSDAERWAVLRRAIQRAGNTSYWRHNLVAYRKFFDLEAPELTDENWAAVNAAIVAKTADPDWYRWVTEDVCGLRTQIRNVPWYEDWEPRYFTVTLRMESALELLDRGVRERFAAACDSAVDTLGELKSALAAYTAGYVARGACGIKLAHAYSRTLDSEPVREAEARAIYERALRGQEPDQGEVKRFQDHLIFFLGELAQEMGLVFQIHTGVQTTWGWVPDSNPIHLLPLIHRFRAVKFDLFHMGYPYVRELGMMGKHCPNVYLNMAWAYVISMEASRQGLSEWIDLVPGARLLAFGSDVRWPEMIYGHLEMARSCLADVLEAKVRRDYLSEAAASALARKMLHDNAVELYGLD